MASQDTSSPPTASARASAAALLPEAVGPNTATTRGIGSGDRGHGLAAGQRLRGRPLDLDQRQLTLDRVTAEQGGLVSPGAAAQHVGIGTAGTLHQHLLGGAD